MKENLYKQLPPIEHRPDGSLYRMTPARRKQANVLIRRECCNCEGGDCIALDDEDAHTCPQIISFSVCCKWFRWSVLPQMGTLEAEIFRDKELKRCAVCGKVFVPKSNRAKYCPDCTARVHGRQKAVNTLRKLQYAGLGRSRSRAVENPTAFTQNPMKRFQIPTSRNPVMVRRRTENRTR